MKKLIYLIVMAMLMSGCATSTMPWDIDRARNNLMKLELGMSKQEVTSVMGLPYQREAYVTPEGNVEYLIYLTKYTNKGSIPESDTTPICLLNGKITGWGRNFYEQQKQKYEVEIKQSARQ